MCLIGADACVTNPSQGGVGVLCPGANLHLTVGETLHACPASLPCVGEIGTDLSVQHLTPSRDESGSEVLLAGCEFTGVCARTRNLMTRYLEGASGV